MGKCEYCQRTGYPNFIMKDEPAYDKEYYLYVQNGQLVVDMSLPDTEYINRIDINYCPMCGRKLGGGEK